MEQIAKFYRGALGVFAIIAALVFILGLILFLGLFHAVGVPQELGLFIMLGGIFSILLIFDGLPGKTLDSANFARIGRFNEIHRFQFFARQTVKNGQN